MVVPISLRTKVWPRGSKGNYDVKRSIYILMQNPLTDLIGLSSENIAKTTLRANYVHIVNLQSNSWASIRCIPFDVGRVDG